MASAPRIEYMSEDGCRPKTYEEAAYILCDGYSVPKADYERVKSFMDKNGDIRSLSPGDFFIAFKAGFLLEKLPQWERFRPKRNDEEGDETREGRLRSKEERNSSILRLAKDCGVSISEIAAQFGLSYARVRGILIATGHLKKKSGGQSDV